MFIVIEGPDGVGTTTQTRALASALREEGYKVHETREPSISPIGVLTRTMLKKNSDEGEKSEQKALARWRSLALLFAADRLQHVSLEIEPALERGEVVICDRYVLSSFVYQGLHVDDEFVTEINRFARVPDLTLVLKLELDEALSRIQTRKGQEEVFDERALQRRVHARYERIGQLRDVDFVDASGTSERVTARLLKIANGVLSK